MYVVLYTSIHCVSLCTTYLECNSYSTELFLNKSALKKNCQQLFQSTQANLNYNWKKNLFDVCFSKLTRDHMSKFIIFFQLVILNLANGNSIRGRIMGGHEAKPRKLRLISHTFIIQREIFSDSWPFIVSLQYPE